MPATSNLYNAEIFSIQSRQSTSAEIIVWFLKAEGCNAWYVKVDTGTRHPEASARMCLDFTFIYDFVVAFTRYIRNTPRIMVIRLFKTDCLQDWDCLRLFANALVPS